MSQLLITIECGMSQEYVKILKQKIDALMQKLAQNMLHICLGRIDRAAILPSKVEESEVSISE
jgi:hypothetical protein